MKNTILTIAVWLIFPALVLSMEKDETLLKETMIPQARELLTRIAQTNDLPSTTNQVQGYKVDYLDDGWLANMQLTNGWVFQFLKDQKETHVSVVHLPGKMEAELVKKTLIPLAREFLLRIGWTNDLPTATNQVKIYRVSYFDDRPGYTADMRLTNGCVFSFHTETNKTEVWSFHRNIKTYYELENPPKEKIEALQALNLQNKLNKKSAQILAEKYLSMLGHKKENFHPLIFYPPGITQGYWVAAPESPPVNERRLPYYEITWYRKDVKLKELEEGGSNLGSVIIEVSGIDLGLISYTKIKLPIGKDF